MLEAELFALFENASDAAFAVRESGKICFWNRAAEALFGFPEKEALEKTCYEVLHGIGVLGTEVCRENCAELQCTMPATRMPILI